MRTLLRGLRETVASLGRGARRESRRRRLVWLFVAALLVLVPLTFNLTRASSFEASVQLFPQRVRPYPAIFDVGYYRSLLDDPELREQMRLNVGAGVADYDAVTIRRGPRPRQLTMNVEADTPRDAQRVVNAVAPQMVGATQRQLLNAARTDAADVRGRLRTRVSRSERRSLRRRLRRLEEFRPPPPPRVLSGAPAPRPRIERWSDKLVDDLPGDFYARPNPVWAALAGLLVALTLWSIALVLAPPEARGSAAEPLPGPD